MAHPREIKFIEDRRKRLIAYKKRKNSLKKAAFQLSTLCNVPTAVLCFDPDGRPDTWPEDDAAVRKIVARHRSLGSQERCIRAVDQLSYLAARVSGHEGQNLKGCPWLDDLPEESLRELANSMESSLEPVKKRIQLLKDAKRCPSNRCSTSEQGQGSLHTTSMQYPDAPTEYTAALEQSGGFFISSEDSVMTFDQYSVNNAFLGVPKELNQEDPGSSASTAFMESLSAPSLPAPLPSTSEHNIAFGSVDHPLFPPDGSFGFLERLFRMGGGDASTCSNRGRKTTAATLEYNRAFGGGLPSLPLESSFGVPESLFLMGGGDASAYLNHGHEAMNDSLVSSPPLSFATSQSTAAALEYNRAFGSDLPFFPLVTSFGVPESQFLMGGGDASAYLNHGQQAMDSLALPASSLFVPSPSIAATSEHNIAFGGDDLPAHFH